MKHISQSKAQAFAPSSPDASGAASAFIANAKKWGEQFVSAQTGLSQFLKENVKAPAIGFLASDPLNMSVFGIVFDGNPGAGFVAVPNSIAERLNDRGLRGSGYFPDMSSLMGKEVMKKLNAVSRAAEQRPLLNSIAGLSSVAIEDGRLVLSRAVITGDSIAILAAPSAVTPRAEVTPIVAPVKTAEISIAESATPTAPSKLRARM